LTDAFILAKLELVGLDSLCCVSEGYAVIMAMQLVVIAGPDRGRIFTLTHEPLLVGRSKLTATQLNDPRCSKVHCQIKLENGQAVVVDQASTAGTFVNSKRVEQQVLQPGDVVTVGETQFRFLHEDLDGSDTVAPGMLRTPIPPPSHRAPTAGTLAELSGTTLHYFQIGPVVARGHSSFVFDARDLKDNRRVALKVLKPEFSRNEEDIQRFIRAMKTMMPLRHPNLIALFGAGKNGPYSWTSMEFVEGESLTQVINRIGTAGMLDWRHALRVATHIGRALDYAQQHNVIHRNITPQNILIQTSDKLTKLGDMNLAKALEGAQAKDITGTGQLVGDLRYMSPERAAGCRDVDGRADIYCLGVTVYAMLTGRPPFEGATLVDTITQIRTAEPVRPRKYQLSIPDLFEAIVLQMLAKRPEDRYPTAADLLRDLDRVAKPQGLSF